jgi:hypothetical protein
MTTALFGNVPLDRKIGSLVEGRPRLLKLLSKNKCGPGQLFAWVNEEMGPRMM